MPDSFPLSRNHATLVGSIAVLLWGTLALFTTWTDGIPPFQLVAMTFTIAFLLALGKWLWRREAPLRHARQQKQVWLVGVGGLFGFHFFYFTALKNAPAAEASLVAYLWPLLIVLFSALLPGERLRWFHLVGAMLGLAGCTLLIMGRDEVQFQGIYMLGYASALACALCWSGYSVLSHHFERVPTDAVGWFCAATAVLALFCHLLLERTVWPNSPGPWLGTLALGAGPVGAAFFVWDVGVKHGDIRVLGACAYAAPLISTLLLVLFGQAEASWSLAIAALAITGGAVLAAGNMLKWHKPWKNPSR